MVTTLYRYEGNTKRKNTKHRTSNIDPAPPYPRELIYILDVAISTSYPWTIRTSLEKLTTQPKQTQRTGLLEAFQVIQSLFQRTFHAITRPNHHADTRASRMRHALRARYVHHNPCDAEHALPCFSHLRSSRQSQPPPSRLGFNNMLRALPISSNCADNWQIDTRVQLAKPTCLRPALSLAYAAPANDHHKNQAIGLWLDSVMGNCCGKAAASCHQAREDR